MDFIRRMLMFGAGLLTGFGLGIATGQLVAPMSGKALADEAQARMDALKAEAQRAAEARQAALKAELAQMTGGAVDLDAPAQPGEATAG